MNEVSDIDPRDLFALLADELPREVRDHVLVVGSLACARYHSDRIVGGTVKTKDAGLVIHPASEVASAAVIAARLLERGWRHKPSDRVPGTATTALEELPFVRLYPPDHEQYFIELLIVPRDEHAGVKPLAHIELEGGWYGLPSFEFLTLTLIERQRSEDGIEYAHPSMMALANLLSHPTLGEHVMTTPVGGRYVQRSSKDLGRVLALARLETREETERWVERWRFALRTCFPTRWPELARRVGDGLRALLDDDVRFDEAWHCCVNGLLAAQGLTREQLRFTALQLLQDAIVPLETSG